MKIVITNKKSGLQVGQEYDICEMSAKTLISQGFAKAVEDVKPAEDVKAIDKNNKKSN